MNDRREADFEVGAGQTGGRVREVRLETAKPTGAETPPSSIVFDVRGLSVHYGAFRAVGEIDLPIMENQITALIGPSGCGKSTVIRCFNRMNDLIPTARVDGLVRYHGIDIYRPEVDPVELRRRVGMVFQKPNPFPKSIYDNVAFGPRLGGYKGSMDDLVEESLVKAALWEEVKNKLESSGMALSGGQQQRLCIARAIATNPDVLLMDEPCSALDPIATLRIEELMFDLKEEYSIIIVTHNMQQAARVSDMTAFFNVKLDETGMRTGRLVEYSPTEQLFTSPDQKETEDYITGRFG
jgi:phosphate transport system ATP-binding protein